MAGWWPSAEYAYSVAAGEIVVFKDFQGTSGDDTIKGTDGDDTIDGLGGNDTLRGGGGDDVIHGSAGDDYINGADGDDTLYGDAGANEIHGGVGDDTIYVNGGVDSIYGGPGRNIVRGGTATTTVYTDSTGIDQIDRAGVWNVDYSMNTDGLTIVSRSRRGDYSTTFSNGSSAGYIDQGDFLLGSGDDSFTTGRLLGFTIDAGGGHDSFKYDVNGVRHFRISLTAASDGTAVLDFGYKKYESHTHYTGFEDFVIDPGRRSGRVYIDAAPLYSGAHLDLTTVSATLDFTTVTQKVDFEVESGNVGHVNGSTFDVSHYTIRLNDLGGRVIASGDLYGGAGDDTLTSTRYDAEIFGRAGNDTLTASYGNDLIAGGDGDDIVNGGGGYDKITGDAGADTIDGGDGNDTIDGGSENDILNGSAGVDHLTGGLGSNTLNGGGDNDTLVSAAGAIDTVDGGAGSDTWSGDYGARPDAVNVTWNGSLTVADGTSVTNVEQVSLVLGGGDDHVAVTGKSGNLLVVAAGAGSDTIDYALTGNAVTVSLAQSGLQNTGGGGPEKITGFENVIGSAFNDTISGDDGSNTLNGGGGVDVVTGGGGADLFVFSSLSDLSTSDDIDKLDRLTDFDHFEGDRIDLSAIDADPDAEGDQAFRFIGTDSFDVDGTGPGELRYSQSVSGYLLVQGDLDHDGKADFSFLVQNTALVSSDLVL